MPRFSDNTDKSDLILFAIRLFVRGLQAILALTVCGLYGVHLEYQTVYKNPPPPAWVYAEVVGGLSFISVFLYFTPWTKGYRLFFWDFVLFIMWLVLFGTFAKMFLHNGQIKPQLNTKHVNGHSDEHTGISIKNMMVACWIDLFNAMLWMFTLIYNTYKFCKARHKAKRNVNDDV